MTLQMYLHSDCQQQYLMSSKPERKLVKKTVIPVTIIDSSIQITGLIHFPTEQNPKAVMPHNTIVSTKKHTISFRREASNQENEEKESKKKEIQYYDLIITPARTKQKYFKVEIPITRGFKSSKNFNRSSQLYYNFSFNNNQGRLTLLNGIQDAKMEIVKESSKIDLTSKEKIQIQQSMLDNRRKEPLNEKDYYQDEDNDSDD